MKKTVKLFGFIVIAAIIGFSFVSCKEEPENILAGTRWERDGQGFNILTFSNSRALFYVRDVQGSTGADYELSEDETGVTFTFTSSFTWNVGTATATISGNTLTIDSVEAVPELSSSMVFTKK